MDGFYFSYHIIIIKTRECVRGAEVKTEESALYERQKMKICEKSILTHLKK